MRTMLFINWL